MKILNLILTALVRAALRPSRANIRQLALVGSLLFVPWQVARAAKESGIGMTVTVDNSAGSGQAITNDITSISFSTPRGSQDITGLDKSGMERLLLLADGKVTINGVFNDASNLSHDVFKSVPTTSVSRTVVIVVSGQTLTMEMNFTDYSMNRGADGSLTWTATGELANGTAPTWS